MSESEALEVSKYHYLIGAVSFCCIGAGAPALSQNILDEPTISQLQDQNVNANDDLIEALRRAALKGPVFRISPKEIVVDMDSGESRSVSVRITNTGDQVGNIHGINMIGSTSGLDMSTTCENELPEGDFCEIDVTYRALSARDVSTAIIGTTNESGRASFEIPVSFAVSEPIPEQVDPEPVISGPIVIPEPEVKVAQPRDIAREYFGGVESNRRPTPGFTIISATKKRPPSTEVAGVTYGDIGITKITQDKRYDTDIPFSDASLPVNRDKILTTDRVIKAVLETPVSNVMCNKVIALVESDVYSATSSRPLIQSGSRVIGECQQFADERVGIAWTRIITTEGRSILFKNRVADTNDATGIGGVPGRVYLSPFDKYVLPVVSTMIDATAGVIFAKYGDDEKVVTDEYGNITSENSAKNEGLRIITGEARGTAQEMIRDIRDVREIAVIPKGSRIDIEIQEDIYFKDDRSVIALADMHFGIDDVAEGTAQRDIPKSLSLTPAGPDYAGATVSIGGRPYRIDDNSAEVIAELEDRSASSRTINELNEIDASKGGN